MIHNRLTYSLTGLVVFLTLITIVFFSGPRVDTTIQLTTPTLPERLDTYLSEREATFNDITPGAEKTIFWAGKPETRTDYVVVYLHGFSATWQETAPLAQRVGEALGANVYNARFTGHGRGSEAMLDGSLNHWLNDTHEAMTIARRLGEKIILIGTSTGGTAATWAALHDRDDLAALVLMSPNFGPADGRAMILTWPWGRQIARLMIGPERSWKPQNDAHARYWTSRYPTAAVLPMMALVKTLQQEDLSTLTAPSLWVYSDNDTVLNVAQIREAYEQAGSGIKQRIIINDSDNPDHHVLAGDILSPSTLPRVVDEIVQFIHRLD